MADKLCLRCAGKPFDKTVRGTCSTPNLPNVPLPQGHAPWTESPSFILCDACSEKFKLCVACQAPLDGGYGFTVPTDKQFCIQEEKDAGNHVEDMNIGEQILARLMVDLYSGKTWQVLRLSPGVKLFGGRVVTDGGRYGTQEIYLDLTQADAKAVIELTEAYRYGGWYAPPSTGNKTWKITVEVKH